MTLIILDQGRIKRNLYTGAYNVKITKKVKYGEQNLQFDMPLEDLAGSGIQPEFYILTDNVRYVIKEVSEDSSGKASVYCELDLDELNGTAFALFESVEQMIYFGVESALTGTGWYCDTTYLDSATSSKYRTLRKQDCSVYDIIKQATSTYGCEVYFDTINQYVCFVSRIGEDRGETFFATDLNLKKLETYSDSHDLYTEIEAYGKDGMQLRSGAWGTVYVDSNGKRFIFNHTYSGKSKRYIWRDERYTVPRSLFEDAQAKLASLAVPVVSYKIDAVDLYRSDTRSTTGLDVNRFQFDIGDTITLIDQYTRTFTKQRIIEMTIYPDEPERNSLVISNMVPVTEELIQETTSTLVGLSATVTKIEDPELDFVSKNITCTVSSSTTASGSALTMRKWGNVVTISGTIVMKATGNNQVVASFDTGAAPTAAMFISCNTAGSVAQSTCLVNTGGEVLVNANTTQSLRIFGVWIL